MKQARREARYIPSDNIVVREIEGVCIIVPLVRGIGDLEEDIFSLDDEGREIWRRLDGKTTLDQVILALQSMYTDENGVIEKDVLGFIDELLTRKMLVEVAPGTSYPAKQ